MNSEEKKYYNFTEKFFNKLAPFYNIPVALLSPIRKRIVKMSEAEKDSVVIDIGCGTGKQAYAFADKAEKVVAVDLNRKMLDIAKKNNRHSNIEFSLQDATNLPYDDNTYDIAIISMVLHDMPFSIIDKTIKEAIRITKNNGKVVILEYGVPKNKFIAFWATSFIKLYESPYYKKFIKMNFYDYLKANNLKIKEINKFMLGSGIVVNTTVNK